MYIQQVELTQGVGKDFVNALTAMSVKEDHEQGDILFRKGDPAIHAFLLLISPAVHSRCPMRTIQFG